MKEAFSELLRSLKKDVEIYLDKDPSISTPLNLILHGGYHVMVLYRFSRFFYTLKLYPIAYLLHYLNRVLFSADIHPCALIEPGVMIDHGIGVVIGSTATVGSGTVIYHGVTLGARVIKRGKRHPDVGRNVLIGAGAKILGDIKIGNGARIGANAVVLQDVPDGATAVGIPARVITKERSHIDVERTLV